MNDAEKIIAIDFDNVIAKEEENGKIGEEIPYACETIKKLTEEGWKIYIHSHRAADPKEKMNMEVWLNSRGLNIPIMEKPFARFYIDDRAIEFNDWNKVYDRLKNDIPVSVIKTPITTILPGIEEHIKMLDTPYLNESDYIAIINRLKNLYGINVTYEEFEKYNSQYLWDSKILRLANKLSANYIQEGDSVLILHGKYLGELGTVYSIKDSEAEIICDSNNKFLRFEDYMNKLKYFPYIFKKACKGPSKLVNKYYPNGLSIEKISKYYKDNFPMIYSYFEDPKIIGVFDVYGSLYRMAIEDINDINMDRLRGVYNIIPNNRCYQPLRIRRGPRFFGEFKNSLADLICALSPYVIDFKLSIEGDKGVILYLLFDKQVNEELLSNLKEVLKDFKHMDIDDNIKVVPAIDSIDVNTGLINKKVSLEDYNYPIATIEGE